MSHWINHSDRPTQYRLYGQVHHIQPGQVFHEDDIWDPVFTKWSQTIPIRIASYDEIHAASPLTVAHLSNILQVPQDRIQALTETTGIILPGPDGYITRPDLPASPAPPKPKPKRIRRR